MSIFTETIEPYKGTKHLNLSMTYDEIRNFLKREGINYSVELWDNRNCNPPVPWKIIRIKGKVSLFFAKESMFKICFEEDYAGSLINGIKTGMLLEKAKAIDNSLVFDDEEEEYQSDEGYWIEDNVDTHNVSIISIYISEVLDDEEFFSYRWADK